MKTYLMPHSFQKAGRAIFIPAVLLGLLMAFDGFDGFPSYLMPSDESSPLYSALASEWMSRLLNNIAIIGICAGAILIACSRERVEDEMIATMRLNSLLTALYISYSLLVVAALAVYDLDFLNVMLYNMFTTAIVFLAVFRYRLWRLRKTVCDEE